MRFHKKSLRKNRAESGLNENILAKAIAEALDKRSINPVYQSSYSSSQRWKVGILAVLLGATIFTVTIKPAKAGWFGEEAAAIIASDQAINAGMKTFTTNLYQAGQTMLMNFLQQTLMNYLQKELKETLGANFGNLVFRQLSATTTSSRTIGAAKGSVLDKIEDKRVKAETAYRLERVVGKNDEHGTESTGGGGADDQKGSGGTAGAVAAARIAMGQEAQRVFEMQAASDALAAGKKDRPGAVPNSKEMADMSKVAATAVSKSQSKAVQDGMVFLDPATTATHEELLYDAILKNAGIDIANYKNTNDDDKRKLSTFLTAQPIIPANAEPAYDNDALLEDRLGILVAVMIGQSATPLLPAAMMNKANSKDLQLKLFTKFSRMQLARHALMWTMMPATHSNMKAEYRDFVLSPSDADAGELRGDIHAKMLKQMRLTQGTNMSLMRLREIQMDQTRLLAVLLTTMVEQTNDANISSNAKK